MKPEHKREVEELARDVMEIVHKAAGRRLYQVMEMLVEQYIHPLERENERLRRELSDRTAGL